MLCSHLKGLRLCQRHRQINIDAENGFRPILCVCVCITIDAMLNFDGDADANAKADVKCEQSIMLTLTLSVNRPLSYTG